MIGEQIKKLRAKAGMTQQNLADQLFVTAQAVSRWENGEVEPSVGTITKMAQIFGVSTDEILGIDSAQQEAPAEPEHTKTETGERDRREQSDHSAQPIAFCERCHSPLYRKGDIVPFYTYEGRRKIEHASCVECEEKVRANQREMARKTAKGRRIKSYIFGGLGAAALLVLLIIGGLFKTPEYIAPGIFTVIGAFTLISCLFLDNNFILDVIAWIVSRSVHMPGVIFSLDLDGIIWFITVKLGLLLLSVAISIALFLFAIALGLVLSVFVYPFAMVKSIKHPEDDN